MTTKLVSILAGLLLLAGCAQTSSPLDLYHDAAGQEGVTAEAADVLAGRFCRLNPDGIRELAVRTYHSGERAQLRLLLVIAGQGVDAYCPDRREIVRAALSA